MENVTAVGIDLSKSVFHLHGINHAGKQMLKKKLRRSNLLSELGKLRRGCRVYIEAGQAAHYWAKEFDGLGLEPRLIAPKDVKPFVQAQKNDYRDAEAIVEAGRRPHQRFVPVKGVEQQELQSIHRIRERHIKNRTALGNQIRGILMEQGVTLPQGPYHVRRYLEASLRDDRLVSITIKELLGDLGAELARIDQALEQLESRLEQRAKQCAPIERVRTIPGVGLLTGTALATVSGNLNEFKNGREFAAFLGLVPRQHSSGGKTRLLGITKQGNGYLRRLLIQGAHAVVRHGLKKSDPYHLWIRKLHAAKGTPRTAVAVANKNARIAWRLLTSGAEFDSSALLRAA